MKAHLQIAKGTLVATCLMLSVSCSGPQQTGPAADGQRSGETPADPIGNEAAGDSPMAVAIAWIEAQKTNDQSGIEAMMTRRHRESVGAFIDYSYANAGFQVEPESQHISTEGKDASVKTIKAGNDWRNIFLRREEDAWRIHLHDLTPGDNPPGNGAAEPLLLDRPLPGWTLETDELMPSPVWIGLLDRRTQTLRRTEPRSRVRIEYLVFDNPEDARSAVWRIRAMALDATAPPALSEIDPIEDAIYVPRHEKYPGERFSAKLALHRGPIAVIAQGVPENEAEMLALAIDARLQP